MESEVRMPLLEKMYFGLECKLGSNMDLLECLVPGMLFLTATVENRTGTYYLSRKDSGPFKNYCAASYLELMKLVGLTTVGAHLFVLTDMIRNF